MVVQFNLLPDIKKQYIKAKRMKRLIMSVSVIAAAASLAIVVLMFMFVQIGQRQDIDNITDDIDDEIAALQSVPELNKILTIQNQLSELPTLHEEKPQTSRLFSILTQVTPADIRIQSVDFNFIDEQMVLAGSATDLASINRYADTLKFATFKTADDEESPAFPSVVTTLNRSEESASYEIIVVFDPALFDNTKTITMVVPEQVTTRSTLGKPDLQLFEQSEGAGN